MGTEEDSEKLVKYGKKIFNKLKS